MITSFHFARLGLALRFDTEVLVRLRYGFFVPVAQVGKRDFLELLP